MTTERGQPPEFERGDPASRADDLHELQREYARLLRERDRSPQDGSIRERLEEVEGAIFAHPDVRKETGEEPSDPAPIPNEEIEALLAGVDTGTDMKSPMRREKAPLQNREVLSYLSKTRSAIGQLRAFMNQKLTELEEYPPQGSRELTGDLTRLRQRVQDIEREFELVASRVREDLPVEQLREISKEYVRTAHDLYGTSLELQALTHPDQARTEARKQIERDRRYAEATFQTIRDVVARRSLTDQVAHVFRQAEEMWFRISQDAATALEQDDVQEVIATCVSLRNAAFSLRRLCDELI